MTEKISRFGAYGVVIDGGKILLSQKKSGPYQGLWGLPGGAIEFGESPEESFRRELLEETGYVCGEEQLDFIATANTEYMRNGEFCAFHQVGIIFKVKRWEKNENITPQEVYQWFVIYDLDPRLLTPFAQQALEKLSLSNV